MSFIESLAGAARRARFGPDSVAAGPALDALVGDVGKLRRRRPTAGDHEIDVATVLPPDGAEFPLRYGLREYRRCNKLIGGTTGSGKSYGEAAILEVILAFILALRLGALVVIVFKPELADLLRFELIPALIARLPAGVREGAARRVRVFSLRDQLLVPLNPLVAPDAATLRVQLDAIAEAIDADGELSDRGRRRFSINGRAEARGGRNLRRLAESFSDDGAMAVLLNQCDDELLARRAATQPTEPRPLLYMLNARLDRLLDDGDMAAMLLAPTCVDWGDLYEDGTATVIDLSGRRPGDRPLVRPVINLVLRGGSRAAAGRPDDPDQEPKTVQIDEAVVGLTPEVGREIADALRVTRSKGVFWDIIGQDLSALARIDPGLLSSLLTNADMVKLYRSPPAAVSAFAHHLPRPAGSGRNAAEAAASLPTRVHYFVDRRLLTTGVLARSLRYDRDAIRREADTLPKDLREAVARGSWAWPIAELRAAAARAEADVLAGAAARTPAPRRRARGDGFPEIG